MHLDQTQPMMRKMPGWLSAAIVSGIFIGIGPLGMAATLTKEDERTEAAPQHSQHGCRRHERRGGDAYQRAGHHPTNQMGAPQKLGIGKMVAAAVLARGAACSRPARLLALPLARRIPQGAVLVEIPSGPSCGPRHGCLHGNPLPLRRDGHIHRTANLSDPDYRRFAADVLDLEYLADLGGDLPPFKCRAALRSWSAGCARSS